MANRCFVHEDARRAPRVAPWLHSSPSRSYFNGGPPNLPHHLMPISLHIQPAHSAYTNLPRVPKWGLQLESSLKCQMGSIKLHVNASECGLKSIRKEESDHASLKGEQISMQAELRTSDMEEEASNLPRKMESEYTERSDIKIQDKESGLSWCPPISLAKFGQEHLFFSSNPETDPEKLNRYVAVKAICS